jgi:hypothetical protein
MLDVVSSFTLSSNYRGLFRQRIEQGGELIVEADVEIVCLDARQELIEFPNRFITCSGDTIHL